MEAEILCSGIVIACRAVDRYDEKFGRSVDDTAADCRP